VNQDRQADAIGTSDSRKPPEERRLALEFERLKLDRQKAGIEFKLKRRELHAAQNRGWKDVFANPLTLAMVGGIITLITTIITGHFSASERIDAETAKARQALQADLIKKFVENPNPESVRANLKFLLDVGLIPNYANSIRSFLDKNPNSALPSFSDTTQSRKVAINRYIRTLATSNDKATLDSIATLLNIGTDSDILDERNTIIIEMDKRVTDEPSMDALSTLLKPLTKKDF
jgi:hypothetical protein